MAKNVLLESLSDLKPLNVNQFQAGLREIGELVVKRAKR